MIAREEWDFSSVDDADLPICLRYEYAREAEQELWVIAESRRKGDTGLLNLELEFADAKSAPGADGVASLIFRARALMHYRVKQNQQDWLDGKPIPRWQFLSVIGAPLLQLGVFGPLGEIMAQEGTYARPPAWQNLTAANRVRVRSLVKHVWGDAATQTACEPASLETLNKFIALNGSNDSATAIQGRAGDSIALLRVDFKNWNNKQIASAFAALVPTLREQAVEWFGTDAREDLGGGRGPEKDRRNLNNLAWMRVRAAYPAGDIEKVVAGNADFRQVFTKQDESGRRRPGALIRDDIDKHCERARVFFRKLFPELGPDAEPESGLTWMQRHG